MGSGLGTQQAAERFYLGQEIELEPPEECVETIPERYEIGEYVICRDEEGFLVSRGEEVIGDFAKGKVLEDKSMALFELDKGMLLEVTPEGHRQIFTREKAGLHGAICADGNFRCGAYRKASGTGYYHKYEIRLYDFDSVTRAAFGRNFKKVYGKEAHDYPRRGEICGYGKDMAYDLSKYGPFGTHEWRVPFRYLDKKGVREWLRFYFEGDGTFCTGEDPSHTAISASSVNGQGLEEVQTLLEDCFGIESTIHLHRFPRTERTRNWSDQYALEIYGRDDVIRYRDEIGFVSSRKQSKLNDAIRRFWGK